jgi:hypothetical protein
LGSALLLDSGEPSITNPECLMMERVNCLLSSGVRLPRADVIARPAAVIAAALQPLAGPL